jgi:membrane associated rhomboid family serine protease
MVEEGDETADTRMFTAPRVVTGLLGLLILVHVIRLALGPGVNEMLIMRLGVVPARYLPGPLGPPLGGPVDAVLALVGYTFLHGGWLHLGVNGVWLLALGSGVARRLGTGRFLLFYFVCGVLAALAYIVAQAGSMAPAIGASGAIAGLLGGVIRFAVARPHADGRHGLVSLLDRRLVILAVLWLVINLAFGRTGLSSLTGGQPIAWEAHLGGFFAGLVLFGPFDRSAARQRAEHAAMAPREPDF